MGRGEPASALADRGGRGASGGQDRSRPVIELLAPRLANTLFLASMAAIISVPLALFLGITAALYRNSIYDRSVNALTLTTISFPEFFVAYLLILILSSYLKLFPSLANIGAETAFWERPPHLPPEAPRAPCSRSSRG